MFAIRNNAARVSDSEDLLPQLSCMSSRGAPIRAVGGAAWDCSVPDMRRGVDGAYEVFGHSGLSDICAVSKGETSGSSYDELYGERGGSGGGAVKGMGGEFCKIGKLFYWPFTETY